MYYFYSSFLHVLSFLFYFFLVSKKQVNVFLSLGVTRNTMFINRTLSAIITLFASSFIPVFIVYLINIAKFGASAYLTSVFLYFIAGASDTTYINDTTLSQARQAVYLKLSEYTNESYFGKDLYESVNKVWLDVDFDKLETEIVAYNIEWFNEIEQQEYALAHLNGGKTTQAVNVYNSPTASSSNIAYTLPKDAEVAVITAPTTPPSGWAYISSDGRFGYIQTQYVEEYDIQEGKYYLLKPIYPTNYEGEQNTVYHQLPINILENGKDYKWSVTLYWSTSGKYNEDDKIDGKLVSVENYFNTKFLLIFDALYVLHQIYQKQQQILLEYHNLLFV